MRVSHASRHCKTRHTYTPYIIYMDACLLFVQQGRGVKTRSEEGGKKRGLQQCPSVCISGCLMNGGVYCCRRFRAAVTLVIYLRLAVIARTAVQCVGCVFSFVASFCGWVCGCVWVCACVRGMEAGAGAGMRGCWLVSGQSYFCLLFCFVLGESYRTRGWGGVGEVKRQGRSERCLGVLFVSKITNLS